VGTLNANAPPVVAVEFADVEGDAEIGTTEPVEEDEEGVGVTLTEVVNPDDVGNDVLEDCVGTVELEVVGTGPAPEEIPEASEGFLRAPVPHGMGFPSGWVALGGGTVLPLGSAIAKRVV